MKCWEYLTIHDSEKFFIMDEDATSTTHELNKLGADGWELVSFCVNPSNGDACGCVAVFKRPLNQ